MSDSPLFFRFPGVPRRAALCLALALLGLALAGCGGGGGSSATPSTTTPDGTRYAKDPSLLTAVRARVAAFQGKSCNMIFIGDSITANWLTIGGALWDKDYVPRDALDFGVGGDTMQNALWRLENLNVRSLRPKVAVVLIGTNNTGDTPAAIAAGAEAVAARTRQMFPGVKVILVSILPNTRAEAQMMAADALLAPFASSQPADPQGGTVSYLNLVPLMPPSDGGYVGIGPDGLHPNAQGYQIWATAMEPQVAPLLPQP